MKKVLRVIAQAACLGGLLVSGGVFAQAGIAISPTTATVGLTGGATSPGTFNVVFTQATPATITAYQTDISFTNAQLTIVPTLPGGAADATSCQIVGGNILRLTDFTVAGTLPSGNACSFTVTAANPQTAGTTYTLNVNATQCSDAASNAVTCAETDSVITVVAGPSAPTVGPLAATTLSAGPINTTATGNVAVNVTGAGVATASLALSCTIPAGANAFAITGGGTQTINAPATVGPATPIGVSCTRGAADATATLTCTQTATPGPNPANLTAVVTCPLGVTAPNPATVPAAPGPVTLIGPPAGIGTGGVSFTNVGGSQTYQITSCVGSGGVTVSTTGFPLTVAVGGQTAVSATCTAPAAAGTTTTITGGLSCTTPVAGFNPTFNVNCTSQILSIPTLGWGGKALMALLMLGFGLVGFQLYRRAA
jgi:hypothetical protein